MFKHRKKNEPLHEEGCDDQNKENEIIEITGDFNDDEQEDFDDDEEAEAIDEQDDTVNKTFINPTQVDNNDCDLTIKCEICDFRARSKSEVNNHKITSHNWCSLCLSSFISQERLKKHIKSKHNKQ